NRLRRVGQSQRKSLRDPGRLPELLVVGVDGFLFRLRQCIPAIGARQWGCRPLINQQYVFHGNLLFRMTDGRGMSVTASARHASWLGAPGPCTGPPELAIAL